MHVIHQCDGLSKVGHEVDLYLGSTQKQVIQEDVLRDFEAEFRSVNLIPVKTGKRGQTLTIAWRALLSVIGRNYDLVLSRNLYFSWVYSQIFRQAVLYETHHIEQGFRAVMQRQLITSSNVTTVLISRQLQEVLEETYHVPVRKTIIVHDAAPEGSRPVESQKKRIVLTGLLKELRLENTLPLDSSCNLEIALNRNPENITSYFGKLYRGRGIERVMELATANPGDIFLVFGELCSDVEALKKQYNLPNLFFMGHVPNGYARRLQATCDILLLPYQRSVSIGLGSHDTARYMSPIKLFEYMASGTPFIASELPVFSEVVANGKHTLMVPPEDPRAWEEAYRKLSSNPALRTELALQAYKRYQENYTWTSRARQIVEQSFDPGRGTGNRRRAA